MADNITNYVKARAELMETRDRVFDLSKLLTDVGRALNQRPTRFIFANTNSQLPMEAAASRDTVSVDARDWPTVDGIMELLAQLHQQSAKVRGLWNVIPANEQSGLQAPPSDRPY